MLVLLVAVLGFLGMTNSAGAQTEGCAYGDDAFVLNLVDPTKDGVITIADLQAIADGLSAESPFKAQLEGLIDDAVEQGVTGIRYDGTGTCAQVTVTATATTPVTTATATATTPVTTATATATTPVMTATATATTPVTTATATETATATTTSTATATATTAPATTAPDDDGDDDGVSELPDTGQGSSNGQGNSTLVMLLGGMSLFIAAAFLWTQRRAA